MAAGLVAVWPAFASGTPARVGHCVQTSVKVTGSRLEAMPESGSTIDYANGERQVSYDVVRAIQRSRPGDRVRLCLVRLPRGCPKGDDRGRVFKATNLRTGERWTAPDTQHGCGGA
jgi:hypothetical protein